MSLLSLMSLPKPGYGAPEEGADGQVPARQHQGEYSVQEKHGGGISADPDST